VPAFSGLGLPYWSASARAAITGLSAHSGRHHVVCAALESIAYQLYDALEAMQTESGVILNSLKADGGPTTNSLLMQFTADIIEREIAVAAIPDCSAQGAALIGFLGLGVHSSLSIIGALPHAKAVYQPSMATSTAQKLRAEWTHAVRQVLAGVT